MSDLPNECEDSKTKKAKTKLRIFMVDLFWYVNKIRNYMIMHLDQLAEHF